MSLSRRWNPILTWWSLECSAPWGWKSCIATGTHWGVLCCSWAPPLPRPLLLRYIHTYAHTSKYEYISHTSTENVHTYFSYKWYTNRFLCTAQMQVVALKSSQQAFNARPSIFQSNRHLTSSHYVDLWGSQLQAGYDVIVNWVFSVLLWQIKYNMCQYIHCDTFIYLFLHFLYYNAKL